MNVGQVGLSELNADPSNPKDGDIFYASDSHPTKDEGLYVYENGEWIDMTTTTDSVAVENVYSAKIANNGTATIVSQAGNFIDSVTRNSTGVVTITFTSNFFSETPAVVATTEDRDGRETTAKNLSTTSIQVNTTDGGVQEDNNFSLTVLRQGDDYVAPVAVGSVIENNYSAVIANNGTVSVSSENIDGWISSTSRVSTGEVTINYADLGLTVAPSITISSHNDADTFGSPHIVTTTSCSLRTRNNGGTLEDIDFSIHLSTQGADHIPHVVGNGDGMCSARIANNGTATITSKSTDFIDTVSRTSTGKVTITWKSGYFTVAPALVCSYESATGFAGEISVTGLSTTQATIETFTYSTGSLTDLDIIIMVQPQL